MMMNSFRTPMWTDEYVFYRLSSGLPNYSSTIDWIYNDRPDLLNNSIAPFEEGRKAYSAIYDNKVFVHNPLAPILVYPVVKTLNLMAENNVIPTIESEPGYPKLAKDLTQDEINAVTKNMQAETITKILRCISIALFILSMVLAYKILSKKVGDSAVFLTVPLAASLQLLTGANLFYWDVFMLFFFVLSLYCLETGHRNWAFLFACCVVNTKMFIGMLFLIPLIVKDRRMFFAAFSLIPFYIILAYSSGSIFYPFVHYFSGNGMATHNFVYTLYGVGGYLLLFISLGIPLFLAMTVPLFWRIKKYPEYIALWICGMAYAWASGLAITHLSCLLYLGALIFPIVVYEFKLYEKLSGWLDKLSGKKIQNNS